MLKVLEPKHGRLPVTLAAVCEILADTEDDITGIGEIVEDCGQEFKPLPGSLAVTADGTVAYVMAPSGDWVKVGGGT